MERIRKVDLNKVSDDQLKNIQETIEASLENICKKAVEEANRLLNVYGMESTIRMDVMETPKPESLTKETPKRQKKASKGK